MIGPTTIPSKTVHLESGAWTHRHRMFRWGRDPSMDDCPAERPFYPLGRDSRIAEETLSCIFPVPVPLRTSASSIGSGKSVIWLDPKPIKSRAHAHGSTKIMLRKLAVLPQIYPPFLAVLQIIQYW